MSMGKGGPVSIEEILWLLRDFDLTVAEVAERLDRTPSLITHRVKKATGLTPCQYRAKNGWIIGERGTGLSPWQQEKVRELYGSGLPLRVVAERIGRSADLVRQALPSLRPPSDYRRLNLDEPEIARRYQAGESTLELAAIYGCHEITIRRVLDRQGTPRRPKGNYLRRHDLPEGEIARRYVAGESRRTLSDVYGCSDALILRVLREHGIERRDRTEGQLARRRNERASGSMTLS